MFNYYFMLGMRSLRRNPVLTILMVLTLAVGVAASVSTLTILHVMSGDPIPHKSARLLLPLIDNGTLEGYSPGARPLDRQMSYIDVANLLASKQGLRRSAMYGVALPVEPARKDLAAFQSPGMATTRDFFAMFDVPFKHGQAWSELDDKAGADVVVLGHALAERLFGTSEPAGARVTMMGHVYQVVGVLKPWQPLPRYYRPIGDGGAFARSEEFFIPFNNAMRYEMSHSGSRSCSTRLEPGFKAVLTSECTWIQFWFETASTGERAQLNDYLEGYRLEQRKLGRLVRDQPIKLFDVMEWLAYMEVIGKDSKLSAVLAFGFLLLCLVNTIGLLLAKFSARATEVSIRRALGASRREIFHQFLIESTVIGLAGAMLGLPLAFGALALIAMQSDQVAAVARMDWLMLLVTLALSVTSAIMAGALPTWRACRVTPALQLKSQ